MKKNSFGFLTSLLVLILLLVVIVTFAGCLNNTTVNDSNQSKIGEDSLSNQGNDSLPYQGPASLLYQGHASLRITTSEGKVIYIDPYVGTGYDVPADMILITHAHTDHNAIKLIETQNPGCVIITNEEALVNGEHKVFEYGFVTVEAVEAGNNPNHNINACVGYILTLSDGKTIYVSGDTSKTDQMTTFSERNLDYAFFCCDGRFNMDVEEAIECANLVQAKHSIPYHTFPGGLFDRERAELFDAEGRLILANGEEIEL